MSKKIYTKRCLYFFIILFSFLHQIVFAQGFVWVKSYGGPNKDKGKDLGADQFGNQYIAGFFTDEINIGSINLQAVGSPADEDIFITKLDVSGDPVWAHSMGNGFSEN